MTAYIAQLVRFCLWGSLSKGSPSRRPMVKIFQLAKIKYTRSFFECFMYMQKSNTKTTEVLWLNSLDASRESPVCNDLAHCNVRVKTELADR